MFYSKMSQNTIRQDIHRFHIATESMEIPSQPWRHTVIWKVSVRCTMDTQS